MGEMSDYELQDIVIAEQRRDDYIARYMTSQDAYDNGFIDEMGVEQLGIKETWDRSSIPTLENLNNELTINIQKLNCNNIEKTIFLNKEATENLKKDMPTCNICRTEMSKETGRYGVFYYCINSCDGQKAVSAKYWNSIRIK